ncbi:hypothetical protein [Bacillus thuringiensis]|uniref:hypothetical protein n=1 Tax=Bacillus thuringiensis TaxID=1428 RepID=UPI003EBE345D
MKKILLSVVTALSVFTLAACGGKEENKLVVGASKNLSEIYGILCTKKDVSYDTRLYK